MKTALLLSTLALLIAGCTTWDANSGKLWTNADNDNLDATAPNGAHLHIDHNHHSPIVHAYGSSGGRLIGAAAAGFTGYEYAKQGLTLAGAAVGMAPTITNRQTNRTTPAVASAVARTGFLAIGSTTVSIVTTGIAVGDSVTGPGIPLGTVVAAVGASTITLSQPATSGGTVTLTFRGAK